jgi:hypothetical protein
VIEPGERVPGVEVWLTPRERVRLDELTPRGEAYLLLFYLFDWSST